MGDPDAELRPNGGGPGAPNAIELPAAMDLPGSARDAIQTTIAAARSQFR